MTFPKSLFYAFFLILFSSSQIAHNMNLISPSPAPNPVYDDNDNAALTIFDVTSFGATGDCTTDDTSAFKMAWDTACMSRGSKSAVVLVPYSFCFLVKPTSFNGPCRTSLVLQIDGIVLSPDGPKSWPWNYKRQWLMFYRVNGLSIQGSGIINGRGQKWWDLPCKPHKGSKGTTQAGPCDSPVAIRIFQSSKVRIKGLNIMNSGQFHVRFDNCNDVAVDSVTIKSPASSPNTDGIHIENTHNVQIRNSVISNGDDCISIGAGCFNVDIMNVTCGPSHGISIGSLGIHNSQAYVSNITVTNSTIWNSDNGVRIKTWQGGSGSVSGIVFSNILMVNVRNPIMIDQYYCQTKNCANQTSAVIISDVLYSNIKGSYDIRSPPIHFGCSDSVPCTNLRLADIDLFPFKGQFFENPFCWNAYGSMEITIPPVYCLLEELPDW
ncbi:Polygalacturonase [Cardamine amara subsp. amara]|uniref:Polygalacturonase n=1 Tax=Cardamine amara subsp. amara TaxID=228776 RepID=A0ABD0ZHT9_CARAN